MLQGLHCADRLVQGGGDLVVVKALVVLEKDHLALVRRQLPQRRTRLGLEEGILRLHP